MRNAGQTAILALALAVLVVSGYTAIKVAGMTERPELAGQRIGTKVGDTPVETERYVGEDEQVWLDRHYAAVKAARRRDADG